MGASKIGGREEAGGAGEMGGRGGRGEAGRQGGSNRGAKVRSWSYKPSNHGTGTHLMCVLLPACMGLTLRHRSSLHAL